MQKLFHIIISAKFTSILQALTMVPVPVTESSSGSGSGDRAWYRSRSQSLLPVPVLVPDYTDGSGTGAICEIQVRSGPSMNFRIYVLLHF